MLPLEFDDHEAIIEPDRTIARNADMPEVCIGVFSHALVEEWVKAYHGVKIDELNSVVENHPLYKMNVDGFVFTLFVPYLGGPGAGGSLEELIARGGRLFVYTGCCGVLRHDIADGHLIVPTAAIRDEGLSFHYVPPSDEIVLDPALTAVATQALDDLALPYITGKTWTTDAFFRETPRKVEKAKRMGAVCVEMECASLAAVARFRRVPFLQFLWSADNLDAPEWERRGLSTNGLHVSEICMAAAIEIAKRCAAKIKEDSLHGD